MVNSIAIERTTCEYKIPMILVLHEHYSSIDYRDITKPRNSKLGFDSTSGYEPNTNRKGREWLI